MTWFHRQNEIDSAIAQGNLKLAIERLQHQRSRGAAGPFALNPAQRAEATRRLVSALVNRAQRAMADGNLLAAWEDLSDAGRLAAPPDADQISRQSTRLIELSLESAQARLAEGRINAALQLIEPMIARQVPDWRLDRIREVIAHLRAADSLAAAGEFERAAQRLQQAWSQQPELVHLEERIRTLGHQQGQLDQLTAELQRFALRCHWHEVQACCRKILKLAPRHEIALTAQKHALKRVKRRTSAGSRLTSVPEGSRRLTDSNSFFQIGSAPQDPRQAALPSDRKPSSERSAERPDAPLPAATEAFLMWVDGVGGFLVCPEPVVLIGQAIEGTAVTIPLQADIRQRHARIERVAGHHLVQPMGPVTLDDVVQDAAFVLRDGQLLGLGEGVQLAYRQPHPLSKSARLEFVSRHRTQPWSDAILLASQSIVLGPNRHNHVDCPRWKSELILFRRSGRWFCRGRQPFRIDDRPVEREGEIRFDSRIAGPDFSLSLEPIVKPVEVRHGS